MGIDKSGVRTVIHVDVPESVENITRKAGRAGRDGQKAYAILLSDATEPARLEKMPDSRFLHRPDPPRLPAYRQLPPTACGQLVKGNIMISISRLLQRVSGCPSCRRQCAKVLEQEGLLNFQQQVFLAGEVQFITGRRVVCL